MIIDGHAHACGAYYSKKSITNSLKEQHIDMIVLCPGEPNSNNFPDTVIIVSHMIGFKEISDNSINTNIYYDMSAPQLISKETLEQAVKRVGCNRIILGSDIPYGERNLQINYRGVLT